MSCNQIWRTIKISDIAEVKGGKRLPKGEELIEYETEHPYIRLVDIKNNRVAKENLMYLSKESHEKISRYIVNQGDVCLAIVGNTIGLVFYITEGEDGYNLTENAARITNFNKDIVRGEYIYYYLLSKYGQHQIRSQQVGSAQGKLPIKNIRDIQINLPLINEQNKIVSILSSLDKKIELNNEMNKTLEEMAQALFKRWFVDFEFPNEEGKPYKSSGGEMVESELGMIPKGWNISSLDKIADYLNGLAMQKYRPETDEYIPVLKIKDLGQGKTDANSDKARIDIPEQYIINDGDVIFAWSGTLMVKIWTGGIAGLNQHLFKVTSTNYDKWFYYLWTCFHLEKFKAIAKDRATTMGHIKRSNLSESYVLIPNKDIYDRLNKVMTPIIEQIIEINIQSKKIVELRDSLLPKLMSGEIRVEDIE